MYARRAQHGQNHGLFWKMGGVGGSHKRTSMILPVRKLQEKRLDIVVIHMLHSLSTYVDLPIAATDMKNSTSDRVVCIVWYLVVIHQYFMFM